MKRGRDEKMMEPMFPRLHVNDAFKGGPRAPPRNKMALYEQLSITSQRFHSPALPNLNSSPTNVAAKSSQAISTQDQCENQCSLSSDSSLVQLEQKKKPVEEDFTVPIFIRPTPSKCLDKNGAVVSQRDSTSNPHHLRTRRDDQSRKRQISKVSAIGCIDNMEKLSPMVKNDRQGTQAGSFMPREPCEDPVPTNRSSDTDTLEHSVCLDNASTPRERSFSEKEFTPQNHNLLHESSNIMDSLEDGSCKLFQAANPEIADSISETSVSETDTCMENLTPDDIVGLIGQKRFWKARRTIADQQRIFSVQVFELHKLIKVQKLVASPDFLIEEATVFLTKPAKPLSKKKPPLDSLVETISNVSKQSVVMEPPSNCTEATAENAVEKTSPSVSENMDQQSKFKPPSGSALVGSNYGSPLYFNQVQGHQFLVPVMSPSEGLVYKPYPGHCFPGQACGTCGSTGSSPNISNFMTPVCGLPTQPHHCPMPFPPMAPYGYFPTYGMPYMNNATFSNSSKDQMKPPAFPTYAPTSDSKPLEEESKEDTEVLASSASSPAETVKSSRGSKATGGRSMFPFFTAYSAAISKPDSEASVDQRRPIKVVPHNSISASESAARIFKSIQEERKQNDSV